MTIKLIAWVVGAKTVKGSSLEILDWIWFFSHGQLYVGFSTWRCMSGNRLEVLLKNEDGGKTANIIYKGILTGLQL